MKHFRALIIKSEPVLQSRIRELLPLFTMEFSRESGVGNRGIRQFLSGEQV